MNETENTPKYLKHFTDLLSFIIIMETGGLRLSSTDGWEDKNDYAALAAYKRKTGAGEIRALCFAQGKEQIHHWFYYAKKDSGCCIHFKDEALLAALGGEPAFLRGSVSYMSSKDFTAAWLKQQPVEKWPFIKRRPYEAEQEYRVIWTGDAGAEPPLIPVAGLIDYITLAPGLAGTPRGEALKKMLETTYKLTVQFSRLLQNDDWISRFNTL
ncbi:MAG: hypothetical protein LBP20_00470 [Treponema sp.]|jgi:hypothetical protein|nr:hypothetical protein [Treponema sp.]